MSVVVIGMEMPNDCPACALSYWASHADFLGCSAVPGKKYAMNTDAEFRKSDTPPDWCPLRPLPDAHGRLIDADAFEAFVQEKWDQNEISNGDWMDFREWLRDQETIIEAEGGSDG